MAANQYKTDPRVLIIVPAYNEAGSLEAVLADLKEEVPGADVVVVDDGSYDNTAAVAGRGGADVLQLHFNLGVGGAMQTGYLYAWEKGYDVAVQFDGDGQHRANQIPALVEEIQSAQADLVIGSRLLGRRSYRFPLMRWIGSRVLAAVVRLTARIRVTDPTSGFRAASARMTHFFARHYPQSYLGDTVEAMVTAARHGMVIREVPARFRGNDASSIGIVSGTLHTLRICLALLIDQIEGKFPGDHTGKALEQGGRP